MKGLRMGGHMGTNRVTIQNLEVIIVDAERNLLAVKGSIPGAKNGIVMIKPSVKGGK
jgi:large subunit ribosomal protein L3